MCLASHNAAYLQYTGPVMKACDAPACILTRECRRELLSVHCVAQPARGATAK